MQAAAAAAQARAQAQAHALARLEGEDSPNASRTNTGNYISRKPSAGAPKRTRSRFREDLPELPLSPPASRVQSPEAEPPMPVLTEQKIHEMEQLRSLGVRYDTPTSGHRSVDAVRRTTPSTMERAYVSPSPEAGMSMSLASIDSEGSWLSGNPSARRAAMRDSIRRANQREHVDTTDSPTNSTEEDLEIVEDEYLTKLTPRRNSGQDLIGRRSGEGRPSSDEEDLVDDADMKWGRVGSQPEVVHRYTMKSHEGLLEMESEDEDSQASPISPSSQEDADIQRAKSVSLGKGHVRNFSAGSAKLLDITPRPSVDARRSSERRRSHVLPAM